jgi:signal peptidase II
MLRSRIPSRFWFLASATLVLDWLTKGAANALLALHQPHALLGSTLRLTLSYDARRTFWFGIPGTPYIRVPGGALAFFAIKFVVLAFMLWLAWRAPRAPRIWTVLLGVLFGAGIGNTVEQVMTGAVINFIDVGRGVHRWPTFNIADVALVTSCLTLAFLMQRDLVRERGWRRSFLGLDFRLPRSLRRGTDDAA